jgi:hypothetical protein
MSNMSNMQNMLNKLKKSLFCSHKSLTEIHAYAWLWLVVLDVCHPCSLFQCLWQLMASLGPARPAPARRRGSLLLTLPLSSLGVVRARTDGRVVFQIKRLDWPFKLSLVSRMQLSQQLV